jgi:putative FmdB family regulatory protein
MPIYEFRCPKCGEVFEELVFGEDARVPCPCCGAKKSEKLLSCCSFKTAGSGPSMGSTGSSGASSCSGCSGKSCSTCK